ncbi:hypothetical protein [Streptomyces rochei]|uniref:hypothetical protein n=1 Tax=Streptomyces rochei TaxID=1928 RepID=UPI00367645B2
MSATVPEVLKDPTVVASFITGAVAFVAAGVAFAAGRMQGRGAHWGPVDAVRRQHQREAYAAFLADLWTYLQATDWDGVTQRTTHDRLLAGLAVDDASVRISSFAVLTAVTSNLHASGSVVFLEGPNEVAGAAVAAHEAAKAVAEAARNGAMNPTAGSEVVTAYRAAHRVLFEEINAFTHAARKRLNSRK